MTNDTPVASAPAAGATATAAPVAAAGSAPADPAAAARFATILASLGGTVSTAAAGVKPVVAAACPVPADDAKADEQTDHDGTTAAPADAGAAAAAAALAALAASATVAPAPAAGEAKAEVKADATAPATTTAAPAAAVTPVPAVPTATAVVAADPALVAQAATAALAAGVEAKAAATGDTATASTDDTPVTDGVPAPAAGAAIPGLVPLHPLVAPTAAPTAPATGTGTGATAPTAATTATTDPAAGTTAAETPAADRHTRHAQHVEAAAPATADADPTATAATVQVTTTDTGDAAVTGSGPAASHVDRERFERLADGLAARLRVSLAGDGARVRMQLTPRELGEVVVRLEVKDGLAHAHLIADSRDAGRMLTAALGDLRTALADRGLRLDSVQVRVAGDAGAAMQGQGQRQHDGGERRTSGSRFAFGRLAAVAGPDLLATGEDLYAQPGVSVLA